MQMSLYKPDSSEEKYEFIIGSSAPSELTFSIIRQFSVCMYIEKRLIFPEKLISLN